MYAIIETGGKQYRVEEGRPVRVDKLPAEKGEEVVFDRVLLYSDEEETRIGSPYLEDCRIKGKVTVQGRGRKIIVFKYKAKKNYRRKQGHRQPFTEVLIKTIEVAASK
ncbi:MAG: 50S ribosomal protein L21 [Firmicutes bacterium]|nr:50S ribosomal protein L21 [Bacillota bacterium]